MGAWSHTSFGNDDASDFLYEVESDGRDALERAIAAVEQTPADGYIESSSASELLAAAELLATVHGKPPQDLPELARALAAKLKPDGGLRMRATASVRRVVAASELRELWEESDELDAWTANAADLIARLQ